MKPETTRPAHDQSCKSLTKHRQIRTSGDPLRWGTGRRRGERLPGVIVSLACSGVWRKRFTSCYYSVVIFSTHLCHCSSAITTKNKGIVNSKGSLFAYVYSIFGEWMWCYESLFPDLQCASYQSHHCFIIGEDADVVKFAFNSRILSYLTNDMFQQLQRNIHATLADRPNDKTVGLRRAVIYDYSKHSFTQRFHLLFIKPPTASYCYNPLWTTHAILSLSTVCIMLSLSEQSHNSGTSDPRSSQVRN